MTVPRFWRGQHSRYNLIGTRCKTCQTHYFPPRKICPKCRRLGQIEEHKFQGTGAIETYTVVHSAPEAFERLIPYVLAIIKLDEGPQVTAQVVCPPEEAKIGMRVHAVFRRMGQEGEEGSIHYGFKFAPDGEAQAGAKN